MIVIVSNNENIQYTVVPHGTVNKLSDYSYDEDEMRQAYRELVYWGRYMRENNCLSQFFGNVVDDEYSPLKSSFSSMFNGGLKRGLSQHSWYDPQLKKTLWIWALLPQHCMWPMLFHFGWDQSQKFKAECLDISERQFKYNLDKGIELYAYYREIPLSAFENEKKFN